jgi:hypothetical protein
VKETHACNPSYQGNRVQENCGWNSVRANSLKDPISKITHHQRGLMEMLKVLAMNSSPCKKKRKRKSKRMTFPIGIMLLSWTMNTKEVTAANKYVT